MREEREDEVVSENTQATVQLLRLLCSDFDLIDKKTARGQYENGGWPKKSVKLRDRPERPVFMSGAEPVDLTLAGRGGCRRPSR